MSYQKYQQLQQDSSIPGTDDHHGHQIECTGDLEKQSSLGNELKEVALHCEPTNWNERIRRSALLSWFSNKRLFLLTGILLTIAVIGSIIVSLKEAFPVSTPQLSLAGLPLSCGKSNEEALERGCVFDLMVYGWTPPGCSHPDLMADALSNSSVLAEYGAAGVFPWYAEEYAVSPLPQDVDVLSKQPVIWASNGWHQAHCLYFWQLLARAVEESLQGGFENTYVLSETLLWSHTYHCNTVLAAKHMETIDEPVIKTLRIYGECVKMNSLPKSTLEHGNFVPTLPDATVD